MDTCLQTSSLLDSAKSEIDSIVIRMYPFQRQSIWFSLENFLVPILFVKNEAQSRVDRGADDDNNNIQSREIKIKDGILRDGGSRWLRHTSEYQTNDHI